MKTLTDQLAAGEERVKQCAATQQICSHASTSQARCRSRLTTNRSGLARSRTTGTYRRHCHGLAGRALTSAGVKAIAVVARASDTARIRVRPYPLLYNVQPTSPGARASIDKA
ncbi:hypothetical protein XACW160_430129 [Xanthomonas citri pv. citri]|uniref:Uncharacterized protein n=1 Tax=Xanthomonas citri pv. citri TaxID=611301 RepID=A0A0U5FIB3_XANCI|nr:hypothetical protein XAC3824_480058 [Xanthomonas citri pv. citri]CEE27335.1 hypothetical protein XAC9322_430109 [Xanthomonas citri pv. citri]CEE28890.1 hypothetical protein XAC1083_430108 [Xanthomonas citri pv. citri]CEE39675.1 hypothetical protein XAC902_540056 [Xanthomonas citri pv. citri]CEE40922.1 hypothetical protein XAC2911_410071 [Xanthomonas citri pv. citri]